MPGFNFGLGLFDERFRSRIVRVQGRDLRLQSLVVACDFGQRLGQLVVGNVRVLADDLQERLGRVLGHPKRLADVDGLMRSTGSVAPFTAASVTCFSCSGVRPKLQVTVLPPDPMPPFVMLHEPGSALSAATVACGVSSVRAAASEAARRIGARFMASASGAGNVQLTLLPPDAIPPETTLQLPPGPPPFGTLVTLASSQARMPKAPIAKAPTATKRNIGARSARGSEEVLDHSTRNKRDHPDSDSSDPGCFSEFGERRKVYRDPPQVDRLPGGLSQFKHSDVQLAISFS